MPSASPILHKLRVLTGAGCLLGAGLTAVPWHALAHTARPEAAAIDVLGHGDPASRDAASIAAAWLDAEVTLRAAPPFTVAAGVLVELVEGCDRRLATCAARFGNVANFRGEPHLPGIDLLTRYPGG